SMLLVTGSPSDEATESATAATLDVLPSPESPVTTVATMAVEAAESGVANRTWPLVANWSSSALNRTALWASRLPGHLQLLRNGTLANLTEQLESLRTETLVNLANFTEQ